MQWSPEQQAFFDTLTEQPSRSVLLEATAGSGKTTTIIEACKRLGSGLSQRFLAFNKDIAEELKKRLPPNVESSTFHSAGYACLVKGAKATGVKFPKVDFGKSRDTLEKHLKKREFWEVSAVVVKLVGLLKTVGAGTELAGATKDMAMHLIRHFDMEIPEASTEERVAEISLKLLVTVGSDLTCVDYDDMLWLPLKYNLPFTPVNVVFVDEAQDTNALRRALLKKMIWQGEAGRVVAVGDPNQAIYGFNGADSEALENLASDFKMLKLPLSVSYRCSQKVVEEARKWAA